MNLHPFDTAIALTSEGDDLWQGQRTGTGYLLGQAQAQAFRDGYFDQTARCGTKPENCW